jgi:predicted ATPase
MLIDAGVIQPGPQSWAFDAARLGALPVPSTRTGLLQARLDGLPEDAGRTIQAAAVVGPVFWDDALAYLDVDTGPPRPALRPALSQLSRREMIFPNPVSAFTASQEYHFKHVLLRQVAYERVLKTARRAYHRRTAEWLVERSRDRANEFAALIAEHFERAGEAEQAAEWFARAGQAARAAYDMDAAILHFRRARSDWRCRRAGTARPDPGGIGGRFASADALYRSLRYLPTSAAGSAAGRQCGGADQGQYEFVDDLLGVEPDRTHAEFRRAG